jgi:drug/metabolite transporter (DMT)-like permease
LKTHTTHSHSVNVSKLKGSLLVLAGASGYGLLSPLVKLAYKAGLSAAIVSIGQVLFGTIMVGIILLIQYLSGIKESKYIEPTGRQKLLLIGAGTFLGLTTVFIYKALELLPASIGIVLLFQFTWMGVVVEVIQNKKRPGNEKLVSLLILLVGTLFASGALETKDAHLSTLGVVWALLSAVSYTMVIYFSGNTVNEAPPFKRTFYMSLGALAITLLFFHPVTLITSMPGLEMLKWGAILGFVGAVLAPVLLNTGLPAVGVALGTIFSAAELPVVVVVSVFVLGEKVSALQWIGVVGIFFAIALPYIITASGNKKR